MSRYEIDKDFRFREARISARKVVLRVLAWLAGSLTLAVVYYVVLSLFLSTDTERRLSRENRMYARLYPELEEKQQLLEDVVRDLQERDNDIYGEIFHTEAPSLGSSLMDASDSLEERKDLELAVERRAAALSGKAAAVDSHFLAVFARLAGGAPLPPADVPVAGMTYAQTGATTGMKISPFSKVESQHTGLDIIAGQGESVVATADGIVKEIERSGKGLGNYVVIDHGNGYMTRYGHLGDIYVSRGQKVTRGRRIAAVGISGKSLVPHLHYEILRDGVPQDPSRYFFGSLGPKAYSEIAQMAAITEQSLD